MSMVMPLRRDPHTPPLSEGAVFVEGRAHNGRPCRVVDNTGTVERALLEELLAELVKARRFGVAGLSATGTSAIRLGAPEFTHIQLGGELYRLILFPYEARLEAF
jgi:hypothetical protein